MTEGKENIFEKITWEDVELEVIRIANFIKSIPDEIRASASERIIGEIVIYGSNGYYDALGILEEAKQGYIDINKKIWAEDDAFVHYGQDCLCLKDIVGDTEYVSYLRADSARCLKVNDGYLIRHTNDGTSIYLHDECFEANFRILDKDNDIEDE